MLHRGWSQWLLPYDHAPTIAEAQDLFGRLTGADTALKIGNQDLPVASVILDPARWILRPSSASETGGAAKLPISGATSSA